MTQGSKASSQLIYKRVMLKISGEALMGRLPYGIDPEMVGTVAQQVKGVAAAGAQVCLVPSESPSIQVPRIAILYVLCPS